MVSSDEENKRMFAIAVEIMIKRTMALHNNKFENNILLTEARRIDWSVCHWDIQLIERMRVRIIKIKLCKRYKDDINLVIEKKTDNNTWVYKMEFEERVMKQVKVLADSIHPSISDSRHIW